MQVATQVRGAVLCEQVDSLRAQLDPPTSQKSFYTLEEVIERKIPERLKDRLGFLRAQKVMEENINGEMPALLTKPHWIIDATDHPRAKEALDEVETKLAAIPHVRSLRLGRMLSLSVDTDLKKHGEKEMPRADEQAAEMFLDSLVRDIQEASLQSVMRQR